MWGEWMDELANWAPKVPPSRVAMSPDPVQQTVDDDSVRL